MEKHLELLGWLVKDRVTEIHGVVTHVGLDLFGCVQALVQPRAIIENGRVRSIEETRWYDTARLVRVGRKPVMTPIPMKGDLVVAGAALDKPVK